MPQPRLRLGRLTRWIVCIVGPSRGRPISMPYLVDIAIAAAVLAVPVGLLDVYLTLRARRVRVAREAPERGAGEAVDHRRRASRTRLRGDHPPSPPME